MEFNAIMVLVRVMMVCVKNRYSKHRFCIFLYCVFITHFSLAQDYTYIHYNVKNGLAGSTVYDLCQDKDGFMWFATEAGISRFDGTHFKNFTTAEGLPETEILRLFPDSRGRVWMSPFKNTVCYYYKGKIYTAANDSLLEKVKVKEVIIDFVEDADKNIALTTGSTVFIITDSSIHSICRLGNPAVDMGLAPVVNGKGIRISFLDSVFIWRQGQFIFERLCRTGPRNIIKMGPGGNQQLVAASGKITTVDMSPARDKTYFVNTFNGSWLVDTLNGNGYVEVFLQGKQVSHTLVDNERNIWFSTLGEGVYKLASREFKTWYFSNSRTSEIFSITRHNNKLLAGTGFGKLYEVQDKTYKTIDFDGYLANAINTACANRLTTMKSTEGGTLVLGFDGYLLKNTAQGNLVNYKIFAIKYVEEIDPQTLVVGTARKVMTVRESDLQVLDTIWPYRSTAVCFYNNQYHVGTSDGLFVVNKDKTATFLGDSIPALRHRTSYFARSPDGSLWIATYGGGVVQMRGNRLMRTITTRQGLASNICRTLLLHRNFLWVGTDKGLTKIDLTGGSNAVTQFTTANGLPSNVINAIYAEDRKVYVGSPAGLTCFDEQKVYDFSKCNIKILDISIGNKPRDIQPAYDLSYKDNNLKVSFVAISFRSEGDIIYRYRLKGLTDNWDSTRQTVLEYPSLPAGDYELQLQAVNKFGVASSVLQIPVSVSAPFWQTLWFNIVVIVAVIAITWLVVAHRFKMIRAREQERAWLQKRMNDLEQMALRAQMNPHFIFNCLNSIQNFIINHNLERSNQYLTDFAQLIRQTLDNSEKGSISISNETLYLKRYLELEKMRFGHSFNYHIEVDPGIDRDFTYIPTMILQPYVENSIRHGLRYKKEGERLVEIKFQQSQDELLCIVQDNGIGRRKANEFKSRMHVEYQSKGMSLTADRINILNRQFTGLITIEIVDLADAYNQPAGTKIVIHFPRSILTKLN
jgi:hypothetical protein